MRITVTVQPEAKGVPLVVNTDGVLVVHVREHTVDGRANTAAIRLLAEYYDVPATSITVVHGQMAAEKVFEINLN